jgi:hypothetical protein
MTMFGQKHNYLFWFLLCTLWTTTPALSDEYGLTGNEAATAVQGAIIENNGYDSNTGDPLQQQAPEPIIYNPVACRRNYGQRFCVAFEQCMNAYGFDYCLRTAAGLR